MRVRTTQNGFVMMFDVIPAILADNEYSLKSFSCHPSYPLKNTLIPSYIGKYNVWKKGVQNALIVYPRKTPLTPSSLSVSRIEESPCEFTSCLPFKCLEKYAYLNVHSSFYYFQWKTDSY